MSVHFSPSLVISPSADFPEHCPVIGWETHGTPDNISATSETTTEPASNLAYPDTIDVWESLVTTSPQYVTMTHSGAYGYFALAGHNLGTAGCTLAVEGDAGAGFVDLAGNFVPGNDAPIMFIFTQGTKSAIRLKISNATVVPTIATIYAGPLLKIPRGIQPGHTPIVDGKQTRISNGVAADGNFLGGIILHEALATSVQIDDLDGDWYRENMRDFMAHANGGLPFFFAWAPQTQPEEIGYCWFRQTPVTPRIGQRTGTFDISMQLAGLAEL